MPKLNPSIPEKSRTPVAQLRSPRPGLSKREKSWSINRPGGLFLAINAAYTTVHTFYLSCMHAFDEQCKQRGESVETFIDKLITKTKADRKLPAHKVAYNIYYLLFRKAENMVRKKYYLQPIHDTFFYDKENKQLEKLLGDPFREVLNAHYDTIPSPDPLLEKKLNKEFPDRWLHLYLAIVEDINETNFNDRFLQINNLPLPPEKDSCTADIYYWSAKLFANYDKVMAVSFYLKHLYTSAAAGEECPLQKVTRKKLFHTEKEKQAFETIVATLRRSKNLESALSEVPYIYTKKYEKIALNMAAIDTVTLRHSQTVQLLNKILADEEETTTIPPATIHTTASNSLLNAMQKGLLQLFHTHNFVIGAEDVTAYAKLHGVFKDPLIESINDRCYELLDDILIEETVAGYGVNEKYYYQVMTAL